MSEPKDVQTQIPWLGLGGQQTRPAYHPIGPNLAKALSAFQRELKPAAKEGLGRVGKDGARVYHYMTLSAVWDAIREPLTNHGLSVLQITHARDVVVLETILLHVSGECVSSHYPLTPVNKDPQGYGSALTYARRYQLCAILGVAPEEDDDGAEASRPSKATKPRGLKGVTDQLRDSEGKPEPAVLTKEEAEELTLQLLEEVGMLESSGAIEKWRKEHRDEGLALARAAPHLAQKIADACKARTAFLAAAEDGAGE